MPYTLYYSPDSANLIIGMALEELGVDYERHWVDRARGEHRRAAFRRLNPQGLLPVLVDGKVPIFETGAILLHLSDRHRALAPQTAGSVERARCYQWLMFISNTLHADLRLLLYGHRYLDDDHAASLPALKAATRERIEAHLTLLEQTMAEHAAPYFLGASVSILDLYLAPLCRWLALYPAGEGFGAVDETEPPQRKPALKRMLTALQQRPAVRRACRAEAIGATPFTAPQPPDLPSDQVTG